MRTGCARTQPSVCAASTTTAAAAPPHASTGGTGGIEECSAAYQRLLMELLRAQRQTLIRLRNEGKIGDKAMHRIEHDLDLEESRLEVS